MNASSRRFILVVTLLSLCACSWAPLTADEIYSPTNWVNDPYSPNPNFGVMDANTINPAYTNNGFYLGTVYGYSPIGAKVVLKETGDTVTISGQVTFSGEVNPDGNLQFRIGLFSAGDSQSDTNWLGYFVGNPVNVADAVPKGLYVRNNPNPGIFASGTPGNAMRPKPNQQLFTPGWREGTYDFLLSVKELSDEAQVITWNLTGQSPAFFNYSGIFTNTFEATHVKSFDHVGFLGGAGLFLSASPSTAIVFSDLTVTLSKEEVKSP